MKYLIGIIILLLLIPVHSEVPININSGETMTYEVTSFAHPTEDGYEVKNYDTDEIIYLNIGDKFDVEFINQTSFYDEQYNRDHNWVWFTVKIENFSTTRWAYVDSVDSYDHHLGKFIITNLENIWGYINIMDIQETEEELIFIGEWDIDHLIQQSISIYDKSSGWLKSFSFNETRKDSDQFEEISYELVSDLERSTLVDPYQASFPSQILFTSIIIIFIFKKKYISK